MNRWILSVLLMATMAHQGTFAKEWAENAKLSPATVGERLGLDDSFGGYPIYQGVAGWRYASGSVGATGGRADSIAMGSLQFAYYGQDGISAIQNVVANLQNNSGAYWTGTPCSSEHLIVRAKGKGRNDDCMTIDPLSLSNGTAVVTWLEVKITESTTSGRYYVIDFAIPIDRLGLPGTSVGDWTAKSVQEDSLKKQIIDKILPWAEKLQDSAAKLMDYSKPQDAFNLVPSFTELLVSSSKAAATPKLTGPGTTTSPSGIVLSGEFRDGQLVKGSRKVPGVGTFTGEFDSSSRLNGQGTFEVQGSSKYVGEFRAGVFEGNGVLTTATGTVLSGVWKGGKMNGPGSSTRTDGYKYEGEFKDNVYDGRGSLTLSNGEKYEGDFKNGKREGMGSVTYSNGNKYKGEWKDSARTGKGTFLWANGDSYEGEFQNNKREGYGTLVLSKGDKYIGEYHDDKRSGKGTYSWENGEKYVGELKEGKEHGQGVKYAADGAILKSGVWESGVFIQPTAGN